MRFRMLLAVIAALSAGVTFRARADGVLRGDGETQTIACAGGAALVGGNRNTATFTGACKGLTIRGDGNKVRIALAGAAGIDIEGSGNQVSYTAAGAPKLHVSGSDTAIVPAAGSPIPTAQDADLSGDNLRVALDCTGHAVTLQGNRSQIRLRGGCQALTVRGEANTVQAELQPGAAVLIEGNGTTVTYTLHGAGADPVATVRGENSRFQPDPSQKPRPAPVLAQEAAPAASPVTEPGAASVPQLMHDLGGTVVEEGTLVHVPATAFVGLDITPAGEALLGQLAALIAQINPTGLAITGRDPADPDIAAKRAAAVQTWLEQHRKSTLPIRTATVTGPDAPVDVLILR